MSAAKVYIILLNWNSWGDTLECLESVLRSSYGTYQVIVCDNDSRDGSMERFRAWSAGEQAAPAPAGEPLRSLSFPPVSKPVASVEYERAAAEAGGDDRAADARVVFIRTGANLGFAGGCNVGLRFALARDDFGYAWLLNNDTVVESGALAAMVAKMVQSPDAGMCGSKLLYYDRPDTVQTLGGYRFNRWLAMPRPLGQQRHGAEFVDEAAAEREMGYVAGASMLVSREFIRQIGLMDDRYFLFFEEMDWAVRSRGRFRLVFAPRSIVYHKEGASTGTNSGGGGNSPLSEYYFNRNRIRFSIRHYPLMLPTVILGILVSLLNRVRRGQPENARMIAKALFGL